MEQKQMNKGLSFPEITLQPVKWGPYQDLHDADRYRAVVDAGTGKLFSIVSKGYKVIRHEEAVDQVERAIDAVPELGDHETFTEFYNEGARIRRTYRFPDRSVKIREDDEVNPEIHLLNSYDLAWPFVVVLGAYRIICANGLVVGKTFFQVKKRHVHEFADLNLQEELSTALDRFNLQTEQWKKWTRVLVTQEQFTGTMEAMKLGKKSEDEIEYRIVQEGEECDADGFPKMTVWAFYNVLTWFITYRAVSLNHRVALEGRLRTAMKKW